MRKSYKAQSATEYLMTYGWAILGIVVVATMLWNMGIFGGAGCQESLRGFAGSKVYVDTIIVHSNGLVDAHVRNAAGAPIKVWNHDKTALACTTDECPITSQYNLPANAEATLLQVANVSSQLTSTTPGNCYSGIDFTINYEVNGLNMSATGKASGTIQP